MNWTGVEQLGGAAPLRPHQPVSRAPMRANWRRQRCDRPSPDRAAAPGRNRPGRVLWSRPARVSPAPPTTTAPLPQTTDSAMVRVIGCARAGVVACRAGARRSQLRRYQDVPSWGSAFPASTFSGRAELGLGAPSRGVLRTCRARARRSQPWRSQVGRAGARRSQARQSRWLHTPARCSRANPSPLPPTLP